jgi:hypothetical protein
MAAQSDQLETMEIVEKHEDEPNSDLKSRCEICLTQDRVDLCPKMKKESQESDICQFCFQYSVDCLIEEKNYYYRIREICPCYFEKRKDKFEFEINENGWSAQLNQPECVEDGNPFKIWREKHTHLLTAEFIIHGETTRFYLRPDDKINECKMQVPNPLFKRDPEEFDKWEEVPESEYPYKIIVKDEEIFEKFADIYIVRDMKENFEEKWKEFIEDQKVTDGGNPEQKELAYWQRKRHVFVLQEIIRRREIFKKEHEWIDENSQLSEKEILEKFNKIRENKILYQMLGDNMLQSSRMNELLLNKKKKEIIPAEADETDKTMSMDEEFSEEEKPKGHGISEPEEIFEVHINALKTVIAATLQREKGNSRIVSREISKIEKLYSQIGLENLAVLLACEHFKSEIGENKMGIFKPRITEFGDDQITYFYQVGEPLKIEEWKEKCERFLEVEENLRYNSKGHEPEKMEINMEEPKGHEPNIQNEYPGEEFLIRMEVSPGIVSYALYSQGEQLESVYRRATETERSHTETELEVLAIIEAIRKFKPKTGTRTINITTENPEVGDVFSKGPRRYGRGKTRRWINQAEANNVLENVTMWGRLKSEQLSDEETSMETEDEFDKLSETENEAEKEKLRIMEKIRLEMEPENYKEWRKLGKELGTNTPTWDMMCTDLADEERSNRENSERLKVTERINKTKENFERAAKHSKARGKSQKELSTETQTRSTIGEYLENKERNNQENFEKSKGQAPGKTNKSPYKVKWQKIKENPKGQDKFEKTLMEKEANKILSIKATYNNKIAGIELFRGGKLMGKVLKIYDELEKLYVDEDREIIAILYGCKQCDFLLENETVYICTDNEKVKEIFKFPIKICGSEKMKSQLIGSWDKLENTYLCSGDVLNQKECLKGNDEEYVEETSLNSEENEPRVQRLIEEEGKIRKLVEIDLKGHEYGIMLAEAIKAEKLAESELMGIGNIQFDIRSAFKRGYETRMEEEKLEELFENNDELAKVTLKMINEGYNCRKRQKCLDLKEKRKVRSIKTSDMFLCENCKKQPDNENWCCEKPDIRKNGTCTITIYEPVLTIQSATEIERSPELDQEKESSDTEEEIEFENREDMMDYLEEVASGGDKNEKRKMENIRKNIEK